MSWAKRCAAALDPAAAELHARAAGALDPAAAWLAAREQEGGEWEQKTGRQLRSASRRERGQRSFGGAWRGWSEQDQDDPLELLAAAQAAAGLGAAALAAATLAADWESMSTLEHASACGITRRRAQQVRAWHLAALQIQGVLL